MTPAPKSQRESVLAGKPDRARDVGRIGRPDDQGRAPVESSVEIVRASS